MSETTAFLAGSAMAGVAALLVLKGGFGLSQPEVPPLYGQEQSAGAVTSTVGSPNTIAGQLSDQQTTAGLLQDQLESQQKLTEELTAQLEKQRESTEELKKQLETQRLEAERVIEQVKSQQRSMDLLTLQQVLPNQTNSDLAQTLRANQQGQSAQVIMLWGLGGIIVVLVVGGGLVLGGLLIVVIQQRKLARTPPPQPNPISLPVPYPHPASYGHPYYRNNDLLLPPQSTPINNTPYSPSNPYYDPY
ncbi:hypothetical protein [Prochlorothrix hollandica]|uniref:Heterocyst differentiation related protein n=1 Tax=Prochlorothrix hollandica PCC 9006 = CALU 1027 TaxID=317619 RepID=A0A0M2Q374_PROHO|nr:hypothetical protein [Prochlorothrix hollandica]KKJ01052.1 hypothetical protein PROH_01145 [Prochlorothrix hollandica PCC 9006 = CALU 1027]